MLLDSEEHLENNIRSIKVFIKQFGTSELSEQEELDILSDFCPFIQYKDIDFTGYYDVINGKEVIKRDPMITRKYDLSINIPSDCSQGTGVNEYIVKIGNKEIKFTTSESQGTDEFNKAKNDSILAFVQSDTDLINVFATGDISISDENKIIATKTLIDEKIDKNYIDTINADYGVDSITLTETPSQLGVKVEIKPINKGKMYIKKGFEANFSFETARVLSSELNGYTPDQICEMKMCLFRDKIFEAVINVVKEAKSKVTTWEHKEEKDLESEEF